MELKTNNIENLLEKCGYRWQCWLDCWASPDCNCTVIISGTDVVKIVSNKQETKFFNINKVKEKDLLPE